MPLPTDDDIVATTLRAMMSLEADLQRAVNGPEPSRPAAQQIAQEMRSLLNQTIAAVGVASAGPCFEPVTRSRETVLKVFGTSAWDDPPSTEGLARAAARAGADDPRERRQAMTDQPKTLTGDELELGKVTAEGIG